MTVREFLLNKNYRPTPTEIFEFVEKESERIAREKIEVEKK